MARFVVIANRPGLEAAENLDRGRAKTSTAGKSDRNTGLLAKGYAESTEPSGANIFRLS